MQNYTELVERILLYGNKRIYRNGERISIFGHTLTYDLQRGMPILTTKYTDWRVAFGEMLWFLSGSTDTDDLKRIAGKNIWQQWEGSNHSIGNMYGKLLRNYPYINPNDTSADHLYGNPGSPDPIGGSTGIDQLWYLLNSIDLDAASTRHRMTTYHPGAIPFPGDDPDVSIEKGKGTLTPCHGLTMLFSIEGDHMNLQMTQASADVLIGLPYNIAQYAFLLSIIAKITGYVPGQLIIHIGDAHIYDNQVLPMMEANFLDRLHFNKPTMEIDKDWSLWDFSLDGIKVNNYRPDKYIQFPVSI